MTRKQLTLIDFSKWVLWIAFLCTIGLAGYYGVSLNHKIQDTRIAIDELPEGGVTILLAEAESKESEWEAENEESVDSFTDRVVRIGSCITVCWSYILANPIEFVYSILVYMMGYYILFTPIARMGVQNRGFLFSTKLDEMKAEAEADFQNKVKEKTERVIQEVLGGICEKMSKDMSELPETISKSTIEIAKIKDYGGGIK